uniref:AbsT3 n=1 Tax=Alcaligenes sp. O-1 TaxID=108557 RepID=Q3LFK9_9BURK|nr:AbsT3 [Alcaligenes sp. O-1]
MIKHSANWTRRSVLKVGAAAALGVAGAASAKGGDRLKIGYLPVNVMLPVYSEEAGFWKDAGLEVELFRAQGGPAILQALLSGAIPAGDVGVAPAVIAGMTDRFALREHERLTGRKILA